MALKYISKNDIIKQINILEIVEEFNIEIEKVSSGNFNYRCRCPSKNHKSGHERTGSCYIDSIHNNFHCFGCNASFNCIDFYMLCSDSSFSDSIKELGNRLSEDSLKNSIEPQYEFNNFRLLLDMSNLLRETMLEHRNDLKWINRLMRKIDQEILLLDPKDEVGFKTLFKKVKVTIKNKYEA